MIEIFIEGVPYCKVINLYVSSIDDVQEGQIIELDNRGWGGMIKREEMYEITKVKYDSIRVIPYTKKIFRAYPSSKTTIY